MLMHDKARMMMDDKHNQKMAAVLKQVDIFRKQLELETNYPVQAVVDKLLEIREELIDA